MYARHVVGAALALAVLAPSADAQIRFCGPSARACGRLTVPLDPSRRSPGEITLYVERHRAKAATEPPLFLLAGGPGESGTRAFPEPAVRVILRRVRRHRDIVVFDQRGTGNSGALSCAALQRASTPDLAGAAERCAALLGPRRAFFRSADSVADIEAVRAAIGYRQVALLGVSYGTRVALAYAAAHPDRVDRLVLDSVVPPEGADPLYRANFRAAPRVLRELCRGRCRGITPNPVRDLERLLRRMRRGPLHGIVVTSKGRLRAELTSFDLFATLAAGDLRSLVRSRLPAAMRSAVLGDRAPLFRLAHVAGEEAAAGPRSFSAATYAATVCEESLFPWDPATPPDQRLVQARARVLAEPPAAFAPFSAETALESDTLELCRRWPAVPPAPAMNARPPDVPTLILTGTQDVRTPREVAQRVAGLLPRARTVVVSGIGHSVVGPDASGCAASTLRRFLTGRRIPPHCAGRPQIHPTPRDPTSLRAVRPARGTHGRRGRTLAAVRLTYQDVLRLFFDQIGTGSLRYADGGLRGGGFGFTVDRASLRDLVYVPGVVVSGRLRSVSILPDGVLHVRGRAAAHGKLRVRDGVMSGRLAGRRVRGRLGPDLLDLAFE